MQRKRWIRLAVGAAFAICAAIASAGMILAGEADSLAPVATTEGVPADSNAIPQSAALFGAVLLALGVMTRRRTNG